MGKIIRKSWLLLASVVLLAPIVAANPSPTPISPCSNCKAVPEGGSGAEYLAALGTICLGGLILSTRLRKRRTS
jgi:hypothetical protein